jgi:seryl-tRNA synthetase
MLDIKFIRKNKEEVRKAILDRKMKLSLERLLDLDEKRRVLKQELDELRQKKNDIAQKIKEDKPTDELIKNGKEVKMLIAEVVGRYKNVEQEFEELMMYVPNIPAKDTPKGKDESDNVVVDEYGKKPDFKFKIRDHVELGKMLDILDLERGVKVSGFRGYFLKNEGVMLHMGVLLYAMEELIKEGFTPMIPPTLNKAFTMYGTGWFPFDMDNIYKVAPAGKMTLGKKKEDENFLVGTAEPSLCGYYADEIIQERDLPIKLCGYSQCYRSEIGSYGKDTKGIYRIHEFAKVEQVLICRGDYKESEKWHEKLMNISKSIMTNLKLPYRIIRMCIGDLGAPKYKQYDIETWMPSRDSYGETHSASNLGDWQARRLNIRYKDKTGKIHFVHMLNNTAIASPRILIALLENNQEKDGSVKIPEVLQKWVGKEKLTPK